MFNLSEELAQNLKVYERFYDSRSAVQSPAKVDAPMVQELYMDTERPVGTSAAKQAQNTAFEKPQAVWEEGWTGSASVTYQSPVPGDLDYLSLLNDRLKTQSRRYPHPITNEMEVIG